MGWVKQENRKPAATKPLTQEPVERIIHKSPTTKEAQNATTTHPHQVR